jgi:hypothetical protein
MSDRAEPEIAASQLSANSARAFSMGDRKSPAEARRPQDRPEKEAAIAPPDVMLGGCLSLARLSSSGRLVRAGCKTCGSRPGE